MRRPRLGDFTGFPVRSSCNNPIQCGETAQNLTVEKEIRQRNSSWNNRVLRQTPQIITSWIFLRWTRWSAWSRRRCNFQPSASRSWSTSLSRDCHGHVYDYDWYCILHLRVLLHRSIGLVLCDYARNTFHVQYCNGPSPN